MAQKAGGGHRAIIYLSHFNDFVEKKKFKMNTIGDVKCSVTKRGFGTTIDLKDVFYHIPLHVESRKYTIFIIDEIV